MSMRENAVNEYGLVFGEKEIEYAKKNLKKQGIKINEIYEIEEALSLCSFGEFSGEVFPVKDSGFDDYENSRDPGEYFMYFPLNYPSLFKGGYSSMEEVEAELRESLKDVFPADYDYRKNVVHIVGTYFG